jgi:deazaflavin-dependent oxidoreductase (nitroreductase family)
MRTKPKPKGLDKPFVPKVIKAMSALNTRVYRATGGRVGRHWRIGAGLRKKVPICLLTTTGRKTGTLRTVPLCYLADDERIVLVASQGGLPKHPLWYLNIVANPDVTVQIGRATRRMHARTADPDERAALWPRMLELYADFASYQSWTDRQIPLVICDPQ